MEQSLILQEEIRALLGNHPWQQLFHVVSSVDSTNSQLRRMAQNGAPAGTCVLALEQTGGRGRQGRSFSSLQGGLYLSLLLRPRCAPDHVSHITPMTAVAACDAIETVSGLRPKIKWINDLVLNQKKLSGILCEMDADFAANQINFIILGIGINVNQKSGDFPEEIQPLATSLRLASRQEYPLAPLAAALVKRLSQMSSGLLCDRDLWLQRYRQDCITLGKEVKILRSGETRYARALDIDENGGLIVRYTDDEIATVSSGEVSVRGIYGYV